MFSFSAVKAAFTLVSIFMAGLGILPFVQIQEDCCEEIQGAEKHGILELRIAFPHISLDNEFEYVDRIIEVIQKEPYSEKLISLTVNLTLDNRLWY